MNGSPRVSGGLSNVPFASRRTVVVIPTVAVCGETYDMLLDTGASYAMLSEAILNRLASGHPDWPYAVGAGGAANMGMGAVEAALPLLRVPDVTIGPFRVPRVGVVGRHPGVFEAFMSRLTAGPVVGAVAGNLLRSFRVEIAYGEGAVYLEQGARVEEHDLDTVGLVLAQQDGERPLIVGVCSSAADEVKAAIRPGDRLLAIDGARVEGVPLADIIPLLGGRPGDARTLVIERKGTFITVRSTVSRIL